jgi:pheromone shutdown protein TraB
MRKLIYVPVIHTSADLGSMAEEATRRGIAGLGKDFWEEHRKTVDRFWNAISLYFDSIDVAGMKIYQDGMVADGEVAEKLVEQGVKTGSKNYELVARLLKRGSVLVKTEEIKLVKQELDRLLAITQAKSLLKKLMAFIRYKLIKNRLLKKRDEFIAKRIDETLDHGEEGIIFIGAFHNIKRRLPKSILITEIKNTEKVREYQKLLPSCQKDGERFEELRKYLRSSR